MEGLVPTRAIVAIAIRSYGAWVSF
jgi:hypothetical protein